MTGALKTLRQRIKSVKSTEKITKVMKVVSASKFKRMQNMLKDSDLYLQKNMDITYNILDNYGEERIPPIFKPKKCEKVLLIAMSSDRGLCGNFNSSLIKETDRLIKDLAQQNKSVTVITAGKKMFSYIKNTHKDLLQKNLEVMKKNISYKDSADLSDDIVRMFRSNEIDSCIVTHYKFTSALNQSVNSDTIIPIQNEELNNREKNLAAIQYRLSDSIDNLLEQLLIDYIRAKIYNAFLQNQTTEHCVRMMAMDGASRNAQKLKNNLTLTYNRLRQAAITTDIIEIISGAESVNS